MKLVLCSEIVDYKRPFVKTIFLISVHRLPFRKVITCMYGRGFDDYSYSVILSVSFMFENC